MYTGQFERSIDSKNRVILPPNIKDALGTIFYLTIASEKKLEIRPIEEFEKFINKIDENNQLDPIVQKYKRFILSSTIKVETDKLGRFLIPTKFLEAAAVKKNIVFVGMGRIIELWSPKILANQQKEFEDEDFINDITKKMLEKGFKL